MSNPTTRTHPCCKCCPSDPIFHEGNPADSHEVPCDSCALDQRARPVIEDLVARLDGADATLRAAAEQAKAEQHPNPARVAHLLSKSEGVRLARSYAEELFR